MPSDQAEAPAAPAAPACAALEPGAEAHFPDTSDRVVHDLTDGSVRRAEAMARDSESRLRAWFESPAIGVAITSPEKAWLEVNTRLCELLGYTCHELLQRTWLELTHPDDVAADVGQFNRVLAGELEGYSLDKRFIRKDGSVLWTLLSLSCVRRPDRSVEYFVAVYKDIGARKRAEAALRESAERLERLAAHLPGVLYEYVLPPDGHGRFLYVGPRCREILEIDEQAMMADANALWRLVHPDDRERVHREDVAANREGKSFSIEHRIVTASGALKWLRVDSMPAPAPPGEPAVWNGFILDITERKALEAALRTSEQRFRQLANQTPVGIYQANAAGKVIFANPCLRAMIGLEGEALFGPNMSRALHPDDRERVVLGWREALATGRPFDGEHRLQQADGRITWVRSSVAPLRDEAGVTRGIVGAVIDLTESRALLSQLALSSRLASMGTLVAGVAHEINNPLAASLSGERVAMELLTELRQRLGAGEATDREKVAGLLDEAEQALLEAQEGSQRVARIVRELKAYGQPDPERSAVQLGEVVRQARRWVPLSVGPEIALEIDDRGAPAVIASFGQLEQVVVNLVSNARKATRPGTTGRITVRIDQAPSGMARLAVTDRGRGIEPALLERIFEPFFTTGDVGQGLGLGLTVCHAIVRSHGGTLAVESAPGQGSTFTVELPAAEVSADRPRQSGPGPGGLSGADPRRERQNHCPANGRPPRFTCSRRTPSIWRPTCWHPPRSCSSPPPPPRPPSSSRSICARPRAAVSRPRSRSRPRLDPRRWSTRSGCRASTARPAPSPTWPDCASPPTGLPSPGSVTARSSTPSASRSRPAPPGSR